METFFIKYRKLLVIAVILCFLCFPFELYRGVEILTTGRTGEGLGAIINACVLFFVAIYVLFKVRKGNENRNEDIMQ
jgi:hypothetical protein